MKKITLLFQGVILLSLGMLSACFLLDDSCTVGGFQIKPVAIQDNGAWSKVSASTLRSVQFVNEKVGYSLNSDRSIQKTSDGGKSWVVLQASLSAIFFVDANNGWAVGDDGIILKTVNGGGSWVAQNSGVITTLKSVYFTDANTGYAVGDDGTILKTTNGGGSWVIRHSDPNEDLYSVCFADANTGYATGTYGAILKTSNAGISWSAQNAGTGFFPSVSFVGNTGWTLAGDDGILHKTTNGGARWTPLSGPGDLANGSKWPLSGNVKDSIKINEGISIHFADANIGWALGSTGFSAYVLLKTTDGGASWKVQVSGRNLNFFSFADASNGWLVEGDSIAVTRDGGETWKLQPYGFNNSLTSIHFLNSNTGWAVDRLGTILKTTDGGASWASEHNGLSYNLVSLQFVDSLTGWMVGGAGLIAKTTDGGYTWINQTSGTTSNLSVLNFKDAATGFVAGTNGTILKTTNGGNTWSSIQPASFSNTWTAVYFADANTGYAVGEGGVIVKTGNGGNSWTAQTSNTMRNLTSVFFTDANTGWVTGTGTKTETSTSHGNYTKVTGAVTGGILLKTTDGGSNWVVQDSSMALDLYSVFFVNATTGYAVGGGSAQYTYSYDSPGNPSCSFPEVGQYAEILKTTDGGLHWTPEKISSGSAKLSSLSCTTSSFCAASSYDGIWLRK